MSKLYDICLIGLGPAGIGFLSSLDKKILKNSICFEKGGKDTPCVCHTNFECSNCGLCCIVSGLGGASRFSCGKISNFPAGSGLLPFWESQESNLINFMNSKIDILKGELNLCKVNVSEEKQIKANTLFSTNDITYKYYDVYEFKRDNYISYISKIVNKAQMNGLTIHYNTEVLKIEEGNYENERVYLITTKGENGISRHYVKKVVLATGNINNGDHLIQNFTNINPKTSYELGIRVTVPTYKLNNILDSHGDLKLKYKDGRTYCVSKNGFIIAYSVNNALFLEGYVDNSEPSNSTNFAIIIKCNDQNTLKAFKETYTKKYNGIPIKQRYNDYINNKISVLDFTEKYVPVQQGNIKDIFSDKINTNIIDFIESVLIHVIKLNRDDIIIYAPELKETNRLEINNNFQIVDNLFVIGAATGKFRGILQSICSGIHCADILGR